MKRNQAEKKKPDRLVHLQELLREWAVLTDQRRQLAKEEQVHPVAVRFEQVFHDSFEADRRRTLAVVCFALGTWVGGMFTAACCRHLAAKGYPITVKSDQREHTVYKWTTPLQIEKE